MISGRVNTYSEAVVSLSVRTDTGFNGYLTLPPALITALRLPFRRSGRALLGDGSSVTFDIHEAVILWGGRLRRVPVDAAETDPLLGMGLLHGHELCVQVIEGGEAVIKPLLMS